MDSKILISVLVFAFVSLGSAYAIPSVGDMAPEISVQPGDGKEMTLGKLKGKVVVMFYNSKDTTNKDSRLRQVLNKFYDEQPGEKKFEVFKLAIIDCSSAFFPIDLVWKSKLVDASKQKKMDIYGDWDGKVSQDYAFSKDDTNFVIIDKNGVIKYIARKEITNEKEINLILALLNQITSDKI